MRSVQLCGNLNIFWHCLSLGLERKHLSSPVATAEFSKFAGILTLTASSFRMDPETVIQSEVSQKEKSKYCILMHTCMDVRGGL